MDEHHLVDAKTELVFTKGCEMFCESIPGEPRAHTGQVTAAVLTRLLAGCILQVTALIQGGSRDKLGTKLFSIIVSAITTGMSSASISCACDTLPAPTPDL
jgi:hypothetical protein